MPAPLPAPTIASLENQQPEGSAILLIGGPGSGKTYSIATLLEAGLEVFVLGTEARFLESLEDACRDKKLSVDKLHWHLVEPMKAPFSQLIASAQLIQQLSYEALSNIKTGIGKGDYGQFIKLLECCNNFIDQRTGVSYGPVDKWGADRALVLDGLSGINLMALDLMVGSKPTRAQGEWGVAMDVEERLINKLTGDTKCFFVLIAHIEREKNEVTGATSITVGALGNKLAPKIPRWFSEVVLAYRDGTNFYWSTAAYGVDLKRRVLPLSEKIPPSFVPIVEAWRKRLTERNKPAIAA